MCEKGAEVRVIAAGLGSGEAWNENAGGSLF